MSDGYDLERFVEAQDSRGTYQRALAELRSGRKTGHWIWYVLPQVAGLGSSSMSQRYAIGSLAEARAYLAHAVLGPRLHECAEAILAHASQRSAEHILGGIDAMKLRSCATLFRRAGIHPGARRVLRRCTRPGDGRAVVNAVERLVDRIDQTRAEVGAAIPDGRRPGRRVLIWGDYFLFETAVALAGAVEPTIL